MKNRRLLFSLALTLLFSFSFTAYTQQKVNLQELKEKQKGFFTRINLGIATGKTNFEDYFSITGPTIPFSIQAGAQLSPSFALYFVYGMLINVNPDITGGNYADLVTIPQLGGGFAYYFGKGKTYFYADLNYGITSIITDGSTGSTNGGLAFNIGYGYDFNIVKRIDLGANIFYHYSTMKDKPSLLFGEPQVTNKYFGVCLSFRFGR